MGIELFKNGIYKAETGFIASSKPMLFGTRYRKQITLDDGAVTRYLNFVTVDMSGWVGFTARANNTNYVRVVEHLDADETGVEINSQPIDGTWNNGNHTHVAFLNTQTDTKSIFTIYFGDIDLGAPGYTSDLTVTADAPLAGDYTIQQDSYYKAEIFYGDDGGARNDFGGGIQNMWTRVSGGNVQIGLDGSFNGGASIMIVNGVVYYSAYEETPTITLIEGTTGANAGAVLVAFKVTGTLQTAAHVDLQDDSLEDVTYELIYLFCNCQLIWIKNSIILANSLSDVENIAILRSMYVDAYFSHQSYQYGATQAEEVVQDRDLSAEFATKKYLCYYDITSNDGIAYHIVDETFQNIETPVFLLEDEVTTEVMALYPDNSGTGTVYIAGTETITSFIQVDDFTADAADDEVTAKNKDLELQTALTQTITENVSF